MQEFYIRQFSELPVLQMHIVLDGRYSFAKFFEAVQNADITFSMKNIDTNVIKIANAPAYIKPRENKGCTDDYIICYDWKKRDTKEAGTYEGIFTINFKDDLIDEDVSSIPNGKLIVPIREKLYVIIEK